MSDDTRELDDHVLGAGFDKSVCTGEHPDVDGACPKLDGDVGGIRGVIQSIAQSTGAATCGGCGCPLTTMAATESPPTEDICPRYNLHTKSGGEEW